MRCPPPGQIALTRADIREDGLPVYQQKTGKKQLKLWTSRLREAVDLALATNTSAPIQSTHILRSRTGRRYTSDGFKAIWQREQRAALDAEAIKERFRFHDLKIKTASDFDGDVQQFIGHKTRSMAERYNRTPNITQILNLKPLKKQ